MGFLEQDDLPDHFSTKREWFSGSFLMLDVAILAAGIFLMYMRRYNPSMAPRGGIWIPIISCVGVFVTGVPVPLREVFGPGTVPSYVVSFGQYLMEAAFAFGFLHRVYFFRRQLDIQALALSQMPDDDKEYVSARVVDWGGGKVLSRVSSRHVTPIVVVGFAVGVVDAVTTLELPDRDDRSIIRILVIPPLVINAVYIIASALYGIFYRVMPVYDSHGIRGELMAAVTCTTIGVCAVTVTLCIPNFHRDYMDPFMLSWLAICLPYTYIMLCQPTVRDLFPYRFRMSVSAHDSQTTDTHAGAIQEAGPLLESERQRQPSGHLVTIAEPHIPVDHRPSRVPHPHAGVTLYDIRRDPRLKEHFSVFLASEFSLEYLRFLDGCEEAFSSDGSGGLGQGVGLQGSMLSSSHYRDDAAEPNVRPFDRQLLVSLYDTYLRPGARLEITMPRHLVSEYKRLLHSENASKFQIQKCLQNMVDEVTYIIVHGPLLRYQRLGTS